MTSVIRVKGHHLSAKETSRIHLLPCNVEYDGGAKVDNYFESTLRKNNEQVLNNEDQHDGLSAVFHGRELRGHVVQMPPGYTGFVLKEENKISSDEEDRSFRVSTKFSEFTFWNLETPPSANDNLQKALQWIDIASAIHDQDEDDSQK